GSLPGATVGSFHLATLETEAGLAGARFPAVDEPALVALLVDPLSFPISVFLQGLNEDHPGLPLVGGVAAGAGRPGRQALILGDESLDEGAVGVTVDGIAVRTVVSQGCAPFGRESVITRAEGNVIHELAGERALDRLRADLVALPPAERRQVAEGILAGLVIDENKSAYGRGDYLMRGCSAPTMPAGRSPSANRCASARRCASTFATRRAPTRTCARRSTANSGARLRPARSSS